MEKVFPAIKTFTNLPVHILLKLYQFGVWVVILTQYYTVFGDTVSLFLFINACLDVLRLRDVMDHDRLARHVWERRRGTRQARTLGWGNPSLSQSLMSRKTLSRSQL